MRKGFHIQLCPGAECKGRDRPGRGRAQLTNLKEPDAVYFNVLRLFTVSYSSAWAVPAATWVTMIFVLVLAFGLKRKRFPGAGLVTVCL